MLTMECGGVPLRLVALIHNNSAGKSNLHFAPLSDQGGKSLASAHLNGDNNFILIQ
jgi:hypothetical protein